MCRRKSAMRAKQVRKLREMGEARVGKMVEVVVV